MSFHYNRRVVYQHLVNLKAIKLVGAAVSKGKSGRVREEPRAMPDPTHSARLERGINVSRLAHKIQTSTPVTWQKEE